MAAPWQQRKNVGLQRDMVSQLGGVERGKRKIEKGNVALVVAGVGQEGAKDAKK
jgi:hypothetical protein